MATKTQTSPIYEDAGPIPGDDVPLIGSVPPPQVIRGRGRGVAVSAEVVARYPTCSTIVAGLNSPKAKLGVILLWGALGMTGLAVLEPFLNNLVSSIDPVEGTESYGAATALARHFPVDAAAMDNGIAALMVQSRAGAGAAEGSPALPLFDFVGNSTCTLGLNPTNVTAWVDSLAVTTAHRNVGRQQQATLDLRVVCTPHRPDALGAGCITKNDMHVQLLVTALEAAEKALPAFTALCDTHPTSGAVAKACDILLPYLNNTEAIREFYHEVAWAEHIAPMIPNITLCPVSTPQTARWLAVSRQANRTLAESATGCTVTVISLDTLDGESLPVPSVNLSLFSVNATVALPPGSLWQLFAAQVATPDNRIALNEFQLRDCDGGQPIGGPLDARVKAFSDALRNVVSSAKTAAGGWLTVRGSSKYLLLAATQEGVDQTMNLSAMTLPVALVILVLMVKNARLVVCTVVNLGACTAVSGLTMYIVGRSMVVSTLAPSMMLAIAMAMSIDYSLFLLSRFQNETAAGRSVVDAVVVMLATSGKIVLVSGGTLLLCFAMMLVLPVSLIRSLGVSAAVTVFMAVTAALTLTPAAILLLPRFFSSTRRFGFTSDGIDCHSCRGGDDRGGGERGFGGGLPVAAMVSVEEKLGTAEEALVTSWWCSFGRAMQRRWQVVLVVLLAVAVPVGVVALSEFRIAIGLLPLLPRDGDATQTLVELQDAFGGSAIFPTTIVVVPPAHATTTTTAGREQWLLATCHELQSAAEWVTPEHPAPAFTAEAFAGSMMVNGTCVSEQLVPKFIGGWSTGYTATTVRVSYRIDPFSQTGQDWMRQLRNATGSGAPTARTGSTYHITSEAANEMDAAQETLNSFPLMLGLMMTAVLVLIGGSFMSVVAPVRAVFCLIWMLAVTMGLSIFTFQSGMLDGLHVDQFAVRPSGAMSWFSPSIALPILIGLGLDYDIFYTEKVRLHTSLSPLFCAAVLLLCVFPALLPPDVVVEGESLLSYAPPRIHRVSHRCCWCFDYFPSCFGCFFNS